MAKETRLASKIWPRGNEKGLTVFAYENVFRLQVSVNNLLGMQMRKRHRYLRGEELSLVFREPLDSNEVAE